MKNLRAELKRINKNSFKSTDIVIFQRSLKSFQKEY